MKKKVVIAVAVFLLMIVLVCGASAMLRFVASHIGVEGTGTPVLREIRIGYVWIMTFTPVALVEMPTDAAPDPSATIAIAAETAQATVAVQVGPRLQPTELVGGTSLPTSLPTALKIISAARPTDLPVTPNTPTWTPVPTNTPTNMPMLTSTPTATPTYTSTPTNTPTATPTRRQWPWPWPTSPCPTCSPLATPCSPLATPGQSPLPTPGR